METLETIYESIVNGQRRQALDQLENSDLVFQDLLEHLEDMGEIHEMVVMFRVAQNNNFILVKGE